MINKSNPTALDALLGWGELMVRESALGRDAEEREWEEEGLFYQRRQWLDWNQNERRHVQLKPDKKKPRPMPVSNYFAKTVNACANQLQPVRVNATPKVDDSATRKAAEYAAMATDAIDQESGIKHLNPILSKHTALWGMGVTYDALDTTEDQQPMDEQQLESVNVLGCLDCGGLNEMDSGSMDDDNIGQQQIPCPDCSSMQTMSWRRDNPVTTSQYVTGKGKIKTEVIPIFEIYLPRKVQNPNLSPLIIWRKRRPLSMARRVYGERAASLKSDDPAVNTGETRIDVLRSLTSYTFAEKMSAELITLTEIWAQWDELPKRLQDVLEEYLEGPQGDDEEESTGLTSDDEEENSAVLGMDDPPDLAQIKKYGFFFTFSQGMMLQFEANDCIDPDDEEHYTPFTFFPWDLDPANVYPKGAGADLVPLQKRLNRLDSLIELAMMTNAAGKWLWPSTQNNKKPPSGDPSDVAEYDAVGDGKVKPEFVQPSPFAASVWQYRASILMDFQELGLSTGVQSGNDQGQKSFRGIAYLGAKAAEQLNTQRYLWETSHCLRYKKCLALAKLYWDEERQVKVAGPNGKQLYQSFSGESLRGLYEISFIPNSSIPKTLDEKLQMLQLMAQYQLLDIADPTVRRYIYELTNLEGVNLIQELQFNKAERDLDLTKQGQMPVESPYQDWNVQLKIFANYTLTEEFEQLDPMLQSFVLAATEYYNQKVSMIQQQNMMQQAQMAAMTGGGQSNSQTGGKSSDPNNKTLNKIPGETVSSAGAQGAAEKQGNSFVQSMGT